MNTLKSNLRQEHWESLSWASTCHQLLTPWQMATLLVETHPRWCVAGSRESAMTYISWKVFTWFGCVTIGPSGMPLQGAAAAHMSLIFHKPVDADGCCAAGMTSVHCPLRWKRGRRRVNPGAPCRHRRVPSDPTLRTAARTTLSTRPGSCKDLPPPRLARVPSVLARHSPLLDGLEAAGLTRSPTQHHYVALAWPDQGT